jgi:hypothetical protein
MAGRSTALRLIRHPRYRSRPLRGGTLLLLAVGAAVASPPAWPSAADRPEANAVRSHTRRFCVVASNDLDKIKLLNWAEETADRFESKLGMKMPFARRVVYLRVREGTPAGEPAVVTGGRISAGSLIQHCRLPPPDRAPWLAAQEGLCRLFLDGFVLREIARRQLGREADGRWVPARIPPLPRWLTRGIALNLHSTLRARSSRLVLEKWQRGEVPPLAELLRRADATPAGQTPAAPAGGQENPAADVEDAACGVFVGWMLSLTNRADCFQRMYAQLADGNAVSPEWIVGCFPGCRSLSDLDTQWDQWILRQQRVVYEVGTVTPQDLALLRAELLLHPGVSGIPETSWQKRARTLRDLLADRKARWVPAAARAKAVGLKILAAGRSPEFAQVVGAYCRFLDALAARQRVGRLERLLTEAEDQLRALEQKLSAQQFPPEDAVPTATNGAAGTNTPAGRDIAPDESNRMPSAEP